MYRKFFNLFMRAYIEYFNMIHKNFIFHFIMEAFLVKKKRIVFLLNKS